MTYKNNIEDGVNEERLLMLANFLDEKVPEENFDLSDVISSCNNVRELKQHHFCGTAACGMGYTPLVFPDLVKYRTNNFGEPYGIRLIGNEGVVDYDDIANILFNLDFDIINTTYFLFAPLNDSDRPTPKQFADRIRHYVKTRELISVKGRVMNA